MRPHKLNVRRFRRRRPHERWPMLTIRSKRKFLGMSEAVKVMLQGLSNLRGGGSYVIPAESSYSRAVRRLKPNLYWKGNHNG